MSWCGASWLGVRKSSLTTEQLIIRPRHLHWPVEQLQPGLLIFCCWNHIQHGAWGHWLSQAASRLHCCSVCQSFQPVAHVGFSAFSAEINQEAWWKAWHGVTHRASQFWALQKGHTHPRGNLLMIKEITSSPPFCSSSILGSRKRSDPFNPAAVARHAKPKYQNLICGFEFCIYSYIKSRLKSQNMLACSD